MKAYNQYAYRQILGSLHRRNASVTKTDLMISGLFEDSTAANLAWRALGDKYISHEDDRSYGVSPFRSTNGLLLTFEFTAE